MQFTKLGRTGLDVSVAGLGCGGHSRLGQKTGSSAEQSISLVKTAIDLGITFIDTAANYGTEEIVGRAINGQRDNLIISTKEWISDTSPFAQEAELISGDEFRTRVEASLKRLNTDYIDVLHLHGIMPHQYAYCCRELLPVLFNLRDEGKIRYLGITERFASDTNHKMFSNALEDNFWDVVMVGFNLVNPSAIHTVFPKTLEKEIATLCMFAVRRALSNQQALRELIDKLDKDGTIDASDINLEDPLGFLVDEGGAESVVDGAYRYCRHTRGMDVILTGTGNPEHLKQNIASINRGPLTASCLRKLNTIFGKVDSVSGD